MPSSLSGVSNDDSKPTSNGEITTSSYPNDEEDLTFPEVCERVHGKVEAFLDKEAKSERVKAVQEQTRRSLNVIEEALRKYRYVDANIWN
jgi:FAD synthetase